MNSQMIDNALETQKFKKYAETADTEERRIELCKKYLKSKGIDVDLLERQTKAHEYVASFRNPLLKRLTATRTVDLDLMQDHSRIKAGVYRDISQYMADELLNQGLIRFNDYTDQVLYRWNVRAELDVAIRKEKP